MKATKRERERAVVDAPKRIYLQHDPEKDGGAFKEGHEITWCTDKINDNDIEYVRADLAKLSRRGGVTSRKRPK